MKIKAIKLNKYGKEVKKIIAKERPKEATKILIYNHELLMDIVDKDIISKTPFEYIDRACKYISDIWAMAIIYAPDKTSNIRPEKIYHNLMHNEYFDLNELLNVLMSYGKGKLKSLGIFDKSNIILTRSAYLIRFFEKNDVDISNLKYNSCELLNKLYYNNFLEMESKNYAKFSEDYLDNIIVKTESSILTLPMIHTDIRTQRNISNKGMKTVDCLEMLYNSLKAIKESALLLIPLTYNKYMSIPKTYFINLFNLKYVKVMYDIISIDDESFYAEDEYDDEACVLYRYEKEFDKKDPYFIYKLLLIVDDVDSIERFLYIQQDYCNSLYLTTGRITVEYIEKGYTKPYKCSYAEFMDKYFRFLQDYSGGVTL